MSDDAQAQQQAEQLRLKANGLYKERKFDEAREAYEQAWQLYPKDIAVLNNLGGQSLRAHARATGTRKQR